MRKQNEMSPDPSEKRKEDNSLSNSSHSEEESAESLEEKSLTLYSKSKAQHCSTGLSKTVKQLTQLFDSTENLSSNIKKLGEASKSFPATSAEAEREFSAARLFITAER
ncbi:hypothetical protein AVEN_8365-1 [Araneus ventricosus]|uniref:Uncharacterized protein n=1 Tax=Araneus ventricosus TaxID=182803 RepID=A0A4Y2P3V5_ARAVE|nr:hypothetical protein AVEN_8365-1 [Araneus ventricosus]